MGNICSAPVYKLETLNNLFIELTAKNCNQRCKNCYIDFPLSKCPKDFISIDIIKEALNDIDIKNLYCIYLTGAEPMCHPDFNAILRLTLKYCNVCICTNGSFLNEKKVRFLKKVEDEAQNQIFFQLSLTHFDEKENDNIKYRGNFRQTIFALKTLYHYNFSSMSSIVNYYNLSADCIQQRFKKIFEENGISMTDLRINCSHPDYEDENFIKPSKKTDCMYGRVLTESGIYTCPFLSGDYRGRVGANFKDFSKNDNAETNFCATCSKNNNFMFSIG